MVVPLCVSSDEDTSQIGLEPILLTSFELNPSLKTHPKYSHILKHWGEYSAARNSAHVHKLSSTETGTENHHVGDHSPEPTWSMHQVSAHV